MPPLARTMVVLFLAASPAWLAAQSPGAGSRPESSQSPLSAAPSTPGLFSWDSNQGLSSPASQARVVPAAFEEPQRPGSGPSAPVAASGEGSLGLRTPDVPGLQTASRPPQEKSSLPPLSPPGRTRPDGASPKPSGLPSLVTTAGSLAVVLGLFFVLAWVMRRTSPGGSVVLPAEVVEVLGRTPVAARQQVYLIRCGKKLVLTHVCAEGVETLTEITEPEEVDRLLGLCRQSQPNSATAVFRQVFQQFAREPAAPGFPGSDRYDDVRLANAGISRRTQESLEDGDV